MQRVDYKASISSDSISSNTKTNDTRRYQTVDMTIWNSKVAYPRQKWLVKTSGYAMVVHGRPKTPKNTSFLGSPSLQGSYSPYILGDTTRPGHVTCVLVWSKSDQRRLRKTLHKQTNRQTDTTKIMVTWPWTNIEFIGNFVTKIAWSWLTHGLCSQT